MNLPSLTQLEYSVDLSGMKINRAKNMEIVPNLAELFSASEAKNFKGLEARNNHNTLEALYAFWLSWSLHSKWT